MTRPRAVTAVLFDGFEPLDVFGPLELFGSLPDQFRLVLAGPGGPVASAHGDQVLTDFSCETVPPPDIVLVPGGRGTRPLVTNAAFLCWLAAWRAMPGWSPRCAPAPPCWPRPACSTDPWDPFAAEAGLVGG
jgi:putative intracellular protease/amidase